MVEQSGNGGGNGPDKDPNHVHSKTCGCAEEHKNTDLNGIDLFGHIDLDRLECFNEKNGGKIRKVVRKLDHKMIHKEDPEQMSTQSDYGPELIISIPFDGECAIKSICIIGAGEGRCPTRMRLYKNETAVDADICENKKPI